MIVVTAMAVSSCTFVISRPGVTAPCSALRVEINTHEVGLSPAQIETIDDAIAEFAALVDRDLAYLGSTDADVAGRDSEDPVLIEVAWPDEGGSELGYAEAEVVDGTYVGGWIMLNPLIRHLPPGVLRRLVLHELGHLYGLGDVDAPNEMMNPALVTDHWGAGDLVGLSLTRC